MPAAPSPSAFSPVRWEPRIYPGSLDQASRVRTDVRRDLAAFPDSVAADVALAASELFANAVEYTASSGENGEAVRALRLSAPDRLRLEVTDGGFTEARPAIPALTGTDWFTAERHRGLLMVSAIALDWGYFPVYEHPSLNLGLVVWAEFGLDPAQVPSGLDRFIHTR
ncbi:hypothetical protein Nans01_48260 [Nocardiopsis ansamitocini]|uniref:Histidine kinase/HSP90-like ATPase domain-containing protein n=1 Tax=Nocardiopsis ansamitocini TaxID=1670832 RepID=A0A9W6PB76_9ACTN|nr:hypothetical protein Nans01_48260 [Nocardiopsis ansamitocini]